MASIQRTHTIARPAAMVVVGRARRATAGALHGAKCASTASFAGSCSRPVGYHGAMPQFAANLSWLYTELPFADRFQAAAQDGFTAVECMFPYALPKQEIAARLKHNALSMVLFNGPPGIVAQASGGAPDPAPRGTAALPGREADFRAGVALALEYAAALQCPRVHLMAGLLPPATQREDLQVTYVTNLLWAAAQAARIGVQILIEPINQRDNPGYFLSRQDHAHAVVQDVGSDSLKVQMDLYHYQVTEGDVSTMLRRYLPTGRVGHIQIAGVPERNEPDTGELHHPYLFSLLDEIGYAGWIGCEYRPRDSTAGGTSRGLDWIRPWLATNRS